MSRIGKKIITIPQGVTVDINDRVVNISGPLGKDKVELLPGVGIEKEENNLRLTIKNNESDKKFIAYHGLFRSLIANIVKGVSVGFEKKLEIVGVGYRAIQQSANIQFQLGFSHDVIFNPPAGIVLEVLDPNNIKVKGISKELVGQVSANIRGLKPPEPYKGKGIRYKDENVRKKAGKTGA